ncbi:MAG: T9SS type A sorting domain-containing protein [Bacteroidetes bacterium]|nr:T9SS type A sorting domain-containing protein [Bacteroidota bacterium]
MKFIFSSIIFFSATLIFAQTSSNGEKLIPLTENAIQKQESLLRSTQRTATFPNDTVALPSAGLRDNFSYDSHQPDTTIWDLTISPPVFVNRTWAFCPPDLGVCTFDGLDINGMPYDSLAAPNSTGRCDSLTSRPLDLSAYSVADSVYLSFWYQAKGRGYAPNTMDSLILQVSARGWNPNQTITNWKTVWFLEGYNPSISDTLFHIVMFKLDSASYFVKGLKFRFINWGSRCGSNDHWHIDDVYMKSLRSAADTFSRHVDFVYPASSGLTDYWAVPVTHFKPSMMASNFEVQIANHDTISTGRSVTYWYDVLKSDNTLLTPIYPNAAGVTQTIMPFATSGYMSYAPITDPPIGWNYTQFSLQSDTTTFRVQHILHSSTDIDTMVQNQKFYNYYAYDDGTAEVGYGLIGTNSSLAYQFTMPIGINDTLKAVQMYFLPVRDLLDLDVYDFQLTVWNDVGNAPGSVIYRQRNQHIGRKFESTDRFVTYTIDSGTVALQSGQKYYIGWVQSTADILYLGFDFNTDHHDKIYYNTTGNWYTSIYNGSLMMRPVFYNAYDVSGIAENSAGNNFSLYPNPANGTVNLEMKNANENYAAVVTDISGREILPPIKFSGKTSIDVAALNAGIYFVRISNEKGEVIGTKKLVVN